MADKLPPSPALPKTVSYPSLDNLARWDTDLIRSLYRLFVDLFRTINQINDENIPLSSIAADGQFDGQIAVSANVPYIWVNGAWEEISLVP